MPDEPIVPVDFANYDPVHTYWDWEDDKCPACGRATDRHSTTQLTHCGQLATTETQ